MAAVGFDQALEAWRYYTFGGFKGKHQCFIFCAGSNHQPGKGVEKGDDRGKFCLFEDQSCSRILDQLD